MVNIADIIEDIIELASSRRFLVYDRIGKKCSYSQEELIAETDQEIDLFDAMDGLTPEEFDVLYQVAIAGGLKSENSKALEQQIDFLYFSIDLDEYLAKGAKLKEIGI